MSLRVAILCRVAVLCLAGGCIGGGPAWASVAGRADATRHVRACHRHGRRHCRSPHRKVNRRKGKAGKRPAGGTTSSGPVGSVGGAPQPAAPGGAEAPAATTGAGSTTGSEAPASGGPAHVQVTAEDTEAFRFVLSRPSVPAGKVIIEFVNHGQDEHNLNALEAAEGQDAGSIPNTAPGAHPTLTLQMKAGVYTLFCSLPGHEAKGMKATLHVE